MSGTHNHNPVPSPGCNMGPKIPTYPPLWTYPPPCNMGPKIPPPPGSDMEPDTHPPPWTDTCENITFPQLRWRAVISQNATRSSPLGRGTSETDFRNNRAAPGLFLESKSGWYLLWLYHTWVRALVLPNNFTKMAISCFTAGHTSRISSIPDGLH